MRGIRPVSGRIERDGNGWPHLVIDQAELAQASYELMVEQFTPEPEPPSIWSKLKAWIKSERQNKQ